MVTVELGFTTSYQAGDHSQRIDGISSAGPAGRAGLRVGDRILAVDGASVADAETIAEVWARHNPGDSSAPLRPSTMARCSSASATMRAGAQSDDLTLLVLRGQHGSR